MRTGLSILHRIDSAISVARKRAVEASSLSARAGEAVLDLQRKQSRAYGQIAQDRLSLIDDGQGGDLGYVDRQAENLLEAHAAAVEAAHAAAVKSGEAVETLETKRRTQETVTAKAVDSYDKAAAKAEADLLKDTAYNVQLDNVERLESTVIRAEEKLDLARDDETAKGEPYRADPFFSYLQNRSYGTREHKGWFLTKWLDGGVARLSGYRQAAENYRRLTAIPLRLQNHVENLQEDVIAAQSALEKLEADWLVSQGVSAKHEASLSAQKGLDDIDNKIAAAEAAHQKDLADQAALTAGETGPYKEAVSLISAALAKQNTPHLQRLAAQTRTREDDAAVDALRELARAGEDLSEDQREAKTLLSRYQNTLSDLQNVRQNFKARRYDAPSSSFKRADLIEALLTQVLSGARSGKDLWKQLTRAQRTNKRYSDTDFGGIDWTEGLRLPRQPSRQRRGYGRRNSGIDIGDVFGVLEGIARTSGGRQSRGWGGNRPTRRRTSIPRRPRQTLPKISFPKSRSGFGGGRRGGGFKTGGGF